MQYAETTISSRLFFGYNNNLVTAGYRLLIGSVNVLRQNINDTAGTRFYFLSLSCYHFPSLSLSLSPPRPLLSILLYYSAINLFLLHHATDNHQTR